MLSLLEKATGLVFALGTVMLSSRGLSKSDFAAWGLFTLFTSFVEMGRSGLLQNGLMRFVAAAKDNKQESEKVISAALLLNVAYSLCSNIVIMLSVRHLAEVYQTPQLTAITPVYLLINVLMAFMTHFVYVQQANLEFRGVFLSAFFFRSILFVWIFLCWLFHWPMLLDFMVWMQAVGAILGACASWYFARPFLPSLQATKQLLGRVSALRPLLVQFFQFGKFVLGTNLSAVFYKNIDKLALGSLLGPGAFAIYDVAGKITQMVEAPSFSIAAVVFPQSAQRALTDGAAGVKRLYERSVGAILAIILPFLLLALLFAPYLVRILAGWQYAESANILRLTAFFGLFMPFAVQFGTILDSTGRPNVNFRYTLFTAVLNLILSYLLVRQFGLFGAAYATLIGYSISFVLMQRLLHRDFGIVWWRAFAFVPEFYRMIWQVLMEKIFKKRTFAP
jgi:O-antigen/teichoic acid export membrane protein